MTLTVDSERFHLIIDEIKAVAPVHWEEVATHKNVRRYDPDWAGFLRAEVADRLYCVTLRDGPRLVGYNIGFYQTEPHVTGRWVAQADAYFILAEYRARGARLLFLRTEAILKAHPTHPAGTIHYHCKPNNEADAFFGALGYDQTATVRSKVLEG